MTKLKRLWAYPVTLIGHALGFITLGKRRPFNPLHNSTDYIGCNFLGMTIAITFGHVVLYSKGLTPNSWQSAGDGKLWAHERAHTHQYEVLGVFFFPVYIACHVLGGMRHSSNIMEKLAASYAQKIHSEISTNEATDKGYWWKPWTL